MPSTFDEVSPEHLRQRGGVKWSTYPDEVLPAFVAELDFAVAPAIRAALSQELERSAYGYPKERAAGPGALAELFAARMQARFGWAADAGGIELLTDVVQGLFVGVLAYA